MRVAFLAARSAFEYGGVGGVESFLRRLSDELVNCGDTVDFLMIRPGRIEIQAVAERISVVHCRSLRDAIRLLYRYDHVVTIYLPPAQRVVYSVFRLGVTYTRRHMPRFHTILFGPGRSRIKWQLTGIDSRAAYANVFGVSPRLVAAATQWGTRSTLLLPPVPRTYFVSEKEKTTSDKTTVAYVGRIDTGKGIQEVVELFLRLRRNPNIRCHIHGYCNPAASDRGAGPVVRWLRAQRDISYTEVNQLEYTPSIDSAVRQVLKETDILLLPYRKLTSTIDTPLLLLEGMASLCAVVTRRVGDIPWIYGDSEFLVSQNAGEDEIQRVVERAPANLKEERQRIARRLAELEFGSQHAAHVFRSALAQRDSGGI